MTAKFHSFDLLLGNHSLSSELPGVIAAFGDDGFLRRETVSRLCQIADLSPDDVRRFDGEECQWIDVHDELATMSLFDSGSRRVAIVSAADKLVKDSRPQLEKWCGSPAADSLLILQIASFPGNTKLFKLIDKTGMCIPCSIPNSGGRSKAPSLAKLQEWLQSWSQSELELKLTKQQTAQVVEAVGTDCGMLHQEVSKLALYTDDNGKLSEGAIREHVGSWRTRTMWEIADAIADGRIAEALLQLDKVFAAGEHPAAVIPQVAWSLRRFAKAAHLILQGRRNGQKISAQVAVGQCGFWGPDAKLAEGRLKRMGLRRASSLSEWLLDLDLKIKGSHSQPARAIAALEQLCMRFV
ncbi:MAG: DNA polymerase III subunit delta [Pirellulaceae bacterium]